MMRPPSSLERQVFRALARTCENIAAIFTIEVRVTILVRTPGIPADGNIVVGNDDLDDAIGALERFRGREYLIRPEEHNHV